MNLTQQGISLPIMDLDEKKICEALKKIRKSKKLGQKVIATALDISQQRVSQFEGGESSLSIGDLDTWCKALEIDPMLFINSIHPLSTEDIMAVGNNETKQAKKDSLILDVKNLLQKAQEL
jgi:transcriptional regulator with XRE-family HTH domain